VRNEGIHFTAANRTVSDTRNVKRVYSDKLAGNILGVLHGIRISAHKALGPIDQAEHPQLTALRYSPELQDLEALESLPVHERIPAIKKQSSHPNPPNGLPILSTTNRVVAVKSMIDHWGCFTSDDPAVLAEDVNEPDNSDEDWIGEFLDVSIREIMDMLLNKLLECVDKE
jgi:hypothetical protein